MAEAARLHLPGAGPEPGSRRPGRRPPRPAADRARGSRPAWSGGPAPAAPRCARSPRSAPVRCPVAPPGGRPGRRSRPRRTGGRRRRGAPAGARRAPPRPPRRRRRTAAGPARGTPRVPGPARTGLASSGSSRAHGVRWRAQQGVQGRRGQGEQHGSQHLDERLEEQRALARAAPRAEHQPTGRGCGDGGLGEQAGLADPGYAAHDDEGGPPARGLGPGPVEAVELGLAADQRRRAPRGRGSGGAADGLAAEHGEVEPLRLGSGVGPELVGEPGGRGRRRARGRRWRGRRARAPPSGRGGHARRTGRRVRRCAALVRATSVCPVTVAAAARTCRHSRRSSAARRRRWSAHAPAHSSARSSPSPSRSRARVAAATARVASSRASRAAATASRPVGRVEVELHAPTQGVRRGAGVDEVVAGDLAEAAGEGREVALRVARGSVRPHHLGQPVGGDRDTVARPPARRGTPAPCACPRRGPVSSWSSRVTVSVAAQSQAHRHPASIPPRPRPGNRS